MLELWWLSLVVIGLLALWAVLRTWSGRRDREGHSGKITRTTRLAQAQRRFHAERERLEAKFVKLAAAGLDPTSPRWADCTFEDDVAYVRSRTSGELSALVAITLATDTGEGPSQGRYGGLAGLQAGTAVFRFDRDHWETDGRALLNLSPSEAIRHYASDLEIVGEELAHRQ
jgi:hypothetical protein